VNHYADFDRYVIGERNEGIRQDMQMLRLEKRLRQNGESRSGAGLNALVSKRTLPPLRRAGLTG
jgi:hypothetical protein